MRMLLNQSLQPLSIAVIKDRVTATTRLIDEFFETGSFPLLKPGRQGVSSSLQNVADLGDGIALIAQEDRMSATARGTLLTVLLDMSQRLPVGFSQGRDEATCHVAVLS